LIHGIMGSIVFLPPTAPKKRHVYLRNPTPMKVKLLANRVFAEMKSHSNPE
jgi:hypothetical protein